MHSLILPIHATTQFFQDIARQLDALSSLQLPQKSLHAVRLFQLRRLTRRIETLIPGHFGHGERTAYYARLLGETIRLTEDQHIDLHYAALLHDIGLLTLPDRLLDEPAAHTLNDYVLVQSHPREGATLLTPYPFLRKPARLIAHHHERWDGAGYPYGLRGIYTPLAARILAIADVFDSIAIRSASLHRALRTLQASAGSQFDPILTATFCARFRDQDQLSPFPLSEGVSPLSLLDRPSTTPATNTRPFQPPKESTEDSPYPAHELLDLLDIDPLDGAE